MYFKSSRFPPIACFLAFPPHLSLFTVGFLEEIFLALPPHFSSSAPHLANVVFPPHLSIGVFPPHFLSSAPHLALVPHLDFLAFPPQAILFFLLALIAGTVFWLSVLSTESAFSPVYVFPSL